MGFVRTLPNGNDEYAGGGYKVEVQPGGAITVKPGDWLSKYSMAIHDDLHQISNFVRRRNPASTDTTPTAFKPIDNPDRIEVGETLYHLPSVGEAPATPSPGLPLDKQKALNLIQAFEKRSGPQAFTKIKRQEVADGLRQRVLAPRWINQGQAGLCPSAAIVFATAKDDPVRYVTFVIDLYEKGYGYLGAWKVSNWNTIPWNVTTRGSDLLYYRPPAEDIHVADWIPMASIRNSENWFWEYDTLNKYNYVPFLGNGGAASWNVADWLRKAGYQNVADNASLLGNATKANLTEAGDLHTQGHKIVMRINAGVLNMGPSEHNKKAGRLSRGNHFVVLTSPITIKKSQHGQLVDFTVYTWGKSRRSIIPQGAPYLRLDVFLTYYYGYISAKY